LITATGAPDAAVQLPLPPAATGSTEQDPELWWQTLEAVLDCLAGQASLARVRRLSLDGTSATLLLCDGKGKALTPALLYRDARARSEAERIATLAPRESGAHGPSASLAKWLHLSETRGLSRAWPVHQTDWLLGRLSGQFGRTDENNALKLGYDPVARRWPEWIGALGLARDRLPRVEIPGTPFGTIRPGHCRRWGLSPEVQVCAGTTDSTAGFLATGATAPGTAVSSLGSTLVLKVLSPDPIFAPEYGVYSHRLGDRWLVGGASNAGGAVLLQHFDRQQLAAMTPRLDPDRPTGLDYYPLPAPGERFPVCDPQLPPRLEPRPADDRTFFQGLLEGLAGIEARGYRLLAELGAPYPDQVISVGGGSRNAAWTRIRQRLLGVPVVTAEQQEAAYGTARLAAGLALTGG
jgi:sugar (pentulose or hexulose) kinase